MYVKSNPDYATDLVDIYRHTCKCGWHWTKLSSLVLKLLIYGTWKL